jgi:hypothetical protein
LFDGELLIPGVDEALNEHEAPGGCGPAAGLQLTLFDVCGQPVSLHTSDQ